MELLGGKVFFIGLRKFLTLVLSQMVLDFTVIVLPKVAFFVSNKITCMYVCTDVRDETTQDITPNLETGIVRSKFHLPSQSEAP